MVLGVALAAPPVLADAATPALTGVVNVNTATSDELQLLPGIGEARAKAVIALRKQRGGFGEDHRPARVSSGGRRDPCPPAPPPARLGGSARLTVDSARLRLAARAASAALASGAPLG
jgi:hypothetical protein